MDDNSVTIDHGHNVKTHWSMTAKGKKPPNPPLEVCHVGDEWRVIQQRTEHVLSTQDNRDDAIAAAEQIAEEHQTEVIVCE